MPPIPSGSSPKSTPAEQDAWRQVSLSADFGQPYPARFPDDQPVRP